MGLVVERLGVLVRHFRRLGEIRGGGQENGEAAIFRRPVVRLAILEIALQRVRRGRRNVARGARRQDEIVDRARLRVDPREGVDEGLGRAQAFDQREFDLPAQIGLALAGEEAALAEAGIA